MTWLHRTIAAVALTAALSLTGCMGQRAPERAPERKGQQEQKGGGGGGGSEKKKEDPITSGANKMKAELGDLRDALEGGQPNEVTKQSRELDDSWEGFERKVETKNPEMYDDIEMSLNRVLAGAQLVPFDTNVMQSEIDKLDKKLDELKDTKGQPEEPKKVDMETGSAAMRHEIAQLNATVDSGDTAKIQKQAKAVDRSWTQFEGEVKQESKQDYQAIEDSLHTLLSEANSSPVDKEKVKKQITKLDSQVAKLSK